MLYNFWTIFIFEFESIANIVQSRSFLLIYDEFAIDFRPLFCNNSICTWKEGTKKENFRCLTPRIDDIDRVKIRVQPMSVNQIYSKTTLLRENGYDSMKKSTFCVPKCLFFYWLTEHSIDFLLLFCAQYVAHVTSSSPNVQFNDVSISFA